MARRIVMKFGGTSMASNDARAEAVARVSEHHYQGDSVVVVVSAMGRKGQPYATDTLLALAAIREETGLCGCDLAPRERDAIAACGEDLSAAVLASELIARDLPAISLRSHQAGIITDGVFGNARIAKVETSLIERRLDEGRIVVVTGFQGVSPDGDITTLGRGGSDTSAVALGVALKADLVEIYTDVDGIYSADPKMVPEAIPIPVLPYREAAEMAHGGARVLHPRAAELAERYSLNLRICNTFSRAPGTLLTTAERLTEEGLDARPDRLARAVTSFSPVAQVSVCDERLAEHFDHTVALLEALAEAHLSLDMINVHPDRLIFTLAADRGAEARAIVENAGYSLLSRDLCAKVSLIGGGIHGVPGVVARIARLLACAGVPILQSVDSSMHISVLVACEQEACAVRALHAGFLNST